jgi:hypothetical protein
MVFLDAALWCSDPVVGLDYARETGSWLSFANANVKSRQGSPARKREKKV